jgi:hypothetical protein
MPALPPFLRDVRKEVGVLPYRCVETRVPILGESSGQRSSVLPGKLFGHGNPFLRCAAFFALLRDVEKQFWAVVDCLS